MGKYYQNQTKKVSKSTEIIRKNYIYQILIFMFQVKQGIIPVVFRDRFSEICHSYPTRFSQNKFCEKIVILNQTKFAISLQGPRLWNSLLNKEHKDCME